MIKYSVKKFKEHLNKNDEIIWVNYDKHNPTSIFTIF